MYNQNRLDLIQIILDEMVATNFVAGINVLIEEKGKEVAYYQSGNADVAAKRPMNRDTICHLYSMSKPITAAAAMAVMEDGKIDLLEPLETYLPEFAHMMVVEGWKPVHAKRSIRVKDLLNMQSGLVYPGTAFQAESEMEGFFKELVDKMGTDEEMDTMTVANRIAKLPLLFHPGEHWKYGTSADIMGAVIEKVSDMPLGDFMKKRFFDPLGMKDTGFFLNEEQKKRMSKVYAQKDGALEEYHHNHLGISLDMNSKPKFESGGAGLLSTLDDYMKFGRMLLQGGSLDGQRILGEDTVRFFTHGGLMPKVHEDLYDWDGMEGFQYGNFMRVMKNNGLSHVNIPEDSYGWDGWLGPYFLNDPQNETTFLMMQQRTDTGTTAYTRRILNVLASARIHE